VDACGPAPPRQLCAYTPPAYLGTAVLLRNCVRSYFPFLFFFLSRTRHYALCCAVVPRPWLSSCNALLSSPCRGRTGHASCTPSPWCCRCRCRHKQCGFPSGPANHRRASRTPSPVTSACLCSAAGCRDGVKEGGFFFIVRAPRRSRVRGKMRRVRAVRAEPELARGRGDFSPPSSPPLPQLLPSHRARALGARRSVGCFAAARTVLTTRTGGRFPWERSSAAWHSAARTAAGFPLALRSPSALRRKRRGTRSGPVRPPHCGPTAGAVGRRGGGLWLGRREGRQWECASERASTAVQSGPACDACSVSPPALPSHVASAGQSDAIAAPYCCCGGRARRPIPAPSLAPRLPPPPPPHRSALPTRTTRAVRPSAGAVPLFRCSA